MGYCRSNSSISAISLARALLPFHAAANSSGVRGTRFSNPLRTTRSEGLVIDVKKSAVVWRSGHS